MDAITNIAGAASKAIWGEGGEHKEPVSGETGNTKAGEPYDAGNLDSTETEAAAASTSTASNIGPIIDGRDASSKTVTNSSKETGIGPVVDGRGANASSSTATTLPSVAAHTADPASTAGGAVAAGTAATAATGGTLLTYNNDGFNATSSAPKTTEGASSTTAGNSSGKLPQPSAGQSLEDSHAVGSAGETAPAVADVKAQAPLNGINPETGKPYDGTRTGSKDDPAASAGGIAGGAQEGDKAGKHRTSKFGAFKEKIKSKLNKKDKA